MPNAAPPYHEVDRDIRRLDEAIAVIDRDMDDLKRNRARLMNVREVHLRRLRTTACDKSPTGKHCQTGGDIGSCEHCGLDLGTD